MPVPEPAIRQDAAPPPYSATFGVGSPNDPKDTMELNAFPERRKVRVTIAGNLTATHKDDGGTRTTTPSGYLNGDCTGRVYVVFAGNQGSYMPACSSAGPFTKEFVAQGQGRIFRDGYGGTTSWYCAAPKQDQFCWNFSGTQQVTVEVIDYPGRMTAYDGSTEKTTIPAAKNLWFAWTPVPNQSDIPKATYNWWFVTADSGRVIQNAVPYGYDAQWGHVPKSGTMYVKVTINGVEKTLSRYIHVGPATLALSATPTEVYVGDSVHFVADIKPDTTTVSDLRWFWFVPPDIISALRAPAERGLPPDPRTRRSGPPKSLNTTPSVESSDSSEVGICAGKRTCDYVVYAKGKMRVHAMVAGSPKFADKPLDPARIDVELTADPASVKEGGKVKFQAKSVPGGRRVRVKPWTWVAGGGQVLTPAASCKEGEDTCDIEVWETGVMQIVATIDKHEGQYAAAADVVVTPCDPLTGDHADSLLANKAVRKQFLDFLAKSNVDDPVDRYTRREVGGRVATDGNGNHILVEHAGGQSTGAGAYEPPGPSQWGSPPPGWQWTNWIWHTHPHTYGETVYGGDALNGRKCEERKGDAEYRKSEGFVRCTSGEGPSVNDLNYGRAPGYGFSGFIIDKAGNFYRHDYPAFNDTQEHDRRIVRWKRQRNSACFAPSPCDTYECRRTR